MSKALLRVNLTPVPSRGKLLITLALAVFAACYWYKYHRLVRAHVEVLTAMTGKMEDLLESRGRFRPEHLTEFRYPHDRARDFARIVHDRFHESESFRRFEELLPAYERLLAVADTLDAPALPRDSSMAAVARHADEVRSAARKVLDALAAEE